MTTYLSRAQAKLNLLATLRQIAAVLPEIGILPAEALKRRDMREPGRREKEKHEEQLAALLMRYWRKQQAYIRERLEYTYPDRKKLPDFIDDIIEDSFDDDGLIADLSRMLNDAAKNGIALFGDKIPLQMDYTLANNRAAKWALEYAGNLIEQLGDTSRKLIREAVAAFIETPGFTIRDVVDRLPFSESRAFNVATTEITRAYAEANLIAGDEFKKEFPDVRVIKTWFTNNDDIVCPICKPLNGMEVELDDGFTTEDGEGVDGPPLHVGCRCWIDITTALMED